MPCYVVVGSDGLDAFGKRLLNIEVEAGLRFGAAASTQDIERAAARIARRLWPTP